MEMEGQRCPAKKKFAFPLVDSEKDDFCRQFQTYGFCLLEYSPECERMLDFFLQFFEERSLEEKSLVKQFSVVSKSEDTSSVFKEKLSWLSGSRVPESDFLEPVSKQLDDMMRQIAHVLLPRVFGVALGDMSDVPLFHDCGDSFGMADAARYHYDGFFRGQEVVAPHYDPGLFVFSLGSARKQSGLQIRHPSSLSCCHHHHDAFFMDVDGPIVWSGHGANILNPLIPPCVHRVIRPKENNNNNMTSSSSLSRTTCWIEACTVEQYQMWEKNMAKKEEEKDSAQYSASFRLRNVSGGFAQRKFVSLQEVEQVTGMPWMKVEASWVIVPTLPHEMFKK